MVGRLRPNDEEMAASISFLASESEEDDERLRARSQLAGRTGPGVGGREIQTKVFVWGLNDKDQLGGPKGSKVSVVCLLFQISVDTLYNMYIKAWDVLYFFRQEEKLLQTDCSENPFLSL